MNNSLLAQIDFNSLQGQASPNLTGNLITDLFNMGSLGPLNIVYFLATSLLVIYLAIGGVSYMTSHGDPKAVANAQQKILYALIGFLVVFSSYWIVQFFGKFLGLGVFGTIFK